ncbi:osteopetrosis-associated transmembrane protein 1 [Salarias fasciatus]|uniref:Osteoclastogenesis associated transmembrane protein 1 n=1 Tax=Salarias fasciatus TaxID=181472 RepID=A0A672H7M2_SALFA|nr:osteopetrosis-associated transmembrane protein 1 [Salarias fasciatus]
MSLLKNSLFSAVLVINVYSLVYGELDSAPSVSPAAAAVFKPGADSAFPLSLLSSPDDPYSSDYCTDLLHIFGQRYVTYVNCLVPAARPVKVCQNCFSSYGSFVEIYRNISDEKGPGNESCRDQLLRSDRLMLVYLLYNNLKDLWGRSNCDQCITENFHSLTNDTLYFMTVHNQTISCFQKYEQGNHTDLCKNCKPFYKDLNELYSGMEKNQTLCIDIEDAMNMTRRQWSKSFNCSLPREETVPVIAVSSFMVFLPIIFYLSSFLHSEQKKRKLIHPKRARSYTSMMNIQDKLS